MQDRAGRDAGEDALLLDQLAGAPQRVLGSDGEPGVEHGGVVQLRDEAFVDVAQAVDELAVAWLGRHHADTGHLLLEEAADAHEGAGRAETGDEMRDRRQVLEELGPRRLVVRPGVRRVAVLVEHHPVGVGRRELLRRRHRLVGAAGGR